ncbi:hypothetical protein ACQUQU_14785 [Thalassolituus sp. LLYu03]|uniref:hypothetical protein n=1 Tax=Thalassolituus sp. LLYu03 TaxID=3421656 RepID=UPI003D296B9A
MALIGSIALLIMSSLLLWASRPGGGWSGSSSARFAAGLILLVHALFSLIDTGLPWSIRLLPQQLSLYAALPLLACTLLAAQLNYHWSRLIWGRVLLALCVVFELMRRAGELPLLLWVTLGVALLSALLAIPRNSRLAVPAAASWGLLMLWYQQTGFAQQDLNLWLAASIVPIVFLRTK